MSIFQQFTSSGICTCTGHTQRTTPMTDSSRKHLLRPGPIMAVGILALCILLSVQRFACRAEQRVCDDMCVIAAPHLSIIIPTSQTEFSETTGSSIK